MNNIDYNLEIIGEKKSYLPRKEFIDPIVNSDKKIFEITADNSYGKTFFLNLLAYALDADKLDDDRILNSIKDSISRYDDETSYALEYDINLDLPDKRVLSLSKIKGRDKLIQLNGGAPISFKSLHNELSIIYDVPSNPSERLNAVIKDLGNWNSNLKNKFEKVARYFLELSKEFDSVRNETKILMLQEKIKTLDVDIKKNEDKIDFEKINLKNLKLLKNLNNLILLFKKKNETEAVLIKKEKEFKTLKKPSKVEKKDSNLIKKLNDELVELEISFKKIIAQYIGYINDDSEILEIIINDTTISNHYNKIKATNLRVDLFDDSDFLINQVKYVESIDFIKDTIIRFIDEKKNGKSYKIHNSYTQIIGLIEDLIENDIDFLLKSATDLDSKKLKNQLQELIAIYKVKNYVSLKSFLNTELKTIKGTLIQYIRTRNQLHNENKKKFVDDNDSKYYKIKAELDNLKSSHKTIINNFNINSGICAIDLNITDLSLLDSIQKIIDFTYSVGKAIADSKVKENINLSIDEIEKKIKKLELGKQELISDKNFKKRSYEIEDARKPSKYNSEQKKSIEKFDRLLKLVMSNLSNYDELIYKIESDKLTEFRHEKDIKFIELAGKIIAYSMDNKLLREDGKFIELKFYDLVKQEFYCEDNIIIKKLDVSTGLASANYLKQRIDNVEGKYVVVLLDEVGNMAQNALDKVIDSIKKLEDQNRLVIAVFTRPNSNGIEIKEY
jgi:hypothetical protein